MRPTGVRPRPVAATASNGIITYVEWSAVPSGHVLHAPSASVRPGRRRIQPPTPIATTGTIVYGRLGGPEPPVTQSPSRASASDVYQNLQHRHPDPLRRLAEPALHGLCHAHGHPGPRRPVHSAIGNATLTDAYGFTAISPIPAGATVQSVGIQGGDTTTAGHATVTYCTAAGTGCTAQTTGNYTGTTYPYVELALPSSITIPGGNDISMPHHRPQPEGHRRRGHGGPRHADRVHPLHGRQCPPSSAPRRRSSTGTRRPGSSGTPPEAAPTPVDHHGRRRRPDGVVHLDGTDPGRRGRGPPTPRPPRPRRASPRPSPSTPTPCWPVRSPPAWSPFPAVGTCTLDGNQAATPPTGRPRGPAVLHRRPGLPGRHLHLHGAGLGHRRRGHLHPDGHGRLGHTPWPSPSTPRPRSACSIPAPSWSAYRGGHLHPRR